MYDYFLDIEEDYKTIKQLYKILCKSAGKKAYLDGQVIDVNNDKIIIDNMLADSKGWKCITGS